jgi:hypothetical protein
MLEQSRDEPATDVACGPRNKDFHGFLSGGHMGS